MKPPRTARFLLYEVQPGDTLGEISDRFFVSVDELQDVNEISDPKSLHAYSLLRVPFDSALRGRDARTIRAKMRDNGKKLPSLALGDSDQYIGALTNPVPGARLSSKFGWRWFKIHEGIDLAAKAGTPIYAAHSGRIVYSGDGLNGYGNIIVLRGEGILTVYGHNKRNLVRAGQTVERGEQIGLVGATGKARGAHLHFETRIKGRSGKNVAVDPMVFFPSGLRSSPGPA